MTISPCISYLNQEHGTKFDSKESCAEVNSKIATFPSTGFDDLLIADPFLGMVDSELFSQITPLLSFVENSSPFDDFYFQSQEELQPLEDYPDLSINKVDSGDNISVLRTVQLDHSYCRREEPEDNDVAEEKNREAITTENVEDATIYRCDNQRKPDVVKKKDKKSGNLKHIHNETERKRRHELNTYFRRLQNEIPDLAHMKPNVSKKTILKMATAHINREYDKGKNMIKEKEVLQRKHDMLKKRLAIAKRAAPTNRRTFYKE